MRRFLRLGIQTLYDALDELRVAKCRQLRFSNSTAMPRIEKEPRRSPRNASSSARALRFGSNAATGALAFTSRTTSASNSRQLALIRRMMWPSTPRTLHNAADKLRVPSALMYPRHTLISQPRWARLRY